MALDEAKQTRKGQSRAQFVTHFLIRGSLLIVLQFFLINPGLVNDAWRLGPSIYVGMLYALAGGGDSGTGHIVPLYIAYARLKRTPK